MIRRRKAKNSNSESEGFVWITFSDLLTTMFLVFMVIALWAISNRDKLTKAALEEKDRGERCIKELQATGEKETKRKAALQELGHRIAEEFALMQKSGICVNARIEEIEETGGFRIFQNEGLEPWFEDSQAKLSNDARLCLRGIGKIWLQQINASSELSSSLEHVLIEGHANSKAFPGQTEEENFLRNLGLSQERALSATRFLIEEIKDPIKVRGQQLGLRNLMIAQGKSYLEPVLDLNHKEDFDRSKRLEFKVVLASDNHGL